MIIQSFDAKIKAGKADEIPQLFTHEGVENADKDGSGVTATIASDEFSGLAFGDLDTLVLMANRGAGDWPEPLIARAEDLYGNNASTPTNPVHVHFTKGPSLTAGGANLTGDELQNLKAGQTVYYRLEYGLAQAQNMPAASSGTVGYDAATPLYDYFYDIDLEINLPAGLLLVGAEKAGNNFVVTPDPAGSDPTEEHSYFVGAISVDEDGRSGPVSGWMDLVIYIGNNGAQNAIQDYTDLTDMVTLEASFDILNKLLPADDPD